jgi:STAM-binding protein
MATPRAASLGLRRGPLSVEDIAKDAGNFAYDADIPLRNWMRTADAIQKQVLHTNPLKL